MNKKRSDLKKDYSSPQEALLYSEERLKLAQEASGAGIWDVNLLTGENNWSEELFRLFGLDPDKTRASSETWKSIIHPEDSVIAAELVADAIKNKTRLSSEFRIIHSSGEIRWIRAIGNTIFDKEGKPLRMIGICLDITSQKEKEEKILELANQRKIALDAARLGWWQYDPVTGISTWDDGYRAIFGVNDYSRANQEILEKIIHPDDLTGLWHEVVKSLNPSDPKPYSAEYRIIRPDGQVRWIEAHGIASFEGENTNRHAVKFTGTVQDITERKNSENEQRLLASAVQNERDRFAALVNSITDEIWFADKEGKITLVNPAVWKEFGDCTVNNHEIEKFAENLEVYNNDGSPRPAAGSPLLRALRGEIITNEEEMVRTPAAGELMYRQVNAAPVRDSNGSIIGSVSVVRDITRRRRNEEMIADNDQRNRILSEVATELLVAQDIQRGIDNICRIVMKFLHCQAFFNFLVEPEINKLHLNAFHGISKNEARSIEWLDFGVAVCGCVARDGRRIIAEDIQNSEDKLTKLIKGYGIKAYCCHPLMAANNVIGTLSFGTNERDRWTDSEISTMETISGLMSVAIKRKRLEEELIQSRANLERAQMIGNIGSWRLNLPKNELVWTKENYRIFGIAEGTPQTYESFLDKVHPEDRDYVHAKWTEALEGKDYDIEHRIVADGKIKWVREKAFLEFDKKGRLLAGFGITQDITTRKNAENDLAGAKMKLDLALENANIGLWELNVKTNKAFMGPRAEKMFGLNPGSFGGTYSAFEKLILEEDLDHVRKALNDTLQNDLPFETIFRTLPVKGKNRFISSRALAGKDKNGNTEFLSGVVFDITDLKEGTENLISRLNMDLLRSNNDLQQFASVASHDLQEPLRMVSSFTQLLQLRYGDKLDQTANEYINFAVEGSKRMYDLINGLLDYSRVQTRTDRFAVFSMDSALAKVKENLKLLISETQAILTNNDLPTITADEHQIIQVLQNLIENGIKFSNGVPRIHISATQKNGMHVFSVRDEGIGIEKQYNEKIFRIFQKLNKEYKGTGIGLAICKTIVERHGGEIWVKSRPGKGAEFLFSVPRSLSQKRQRSMSN